MQRKRKQPQVFGIRRYLTRARVCVRIGLQKLTSHDRKRGKMACFFDNLLLNFAAANPGKQRHDGYFCALNFGVFIIYIQEPFFCCSFGRFCRKLRCFSGEFSTIPTRARAHGVICTALTPCTHTGTNISLTSTTWCLLMHSTCGHMDTKPAHNTRA